MVAGLLLSETVCFDRWKSRLPLDHCLGGFFADTGGGLQKRSQARKGGDSADLNPCLQPRQETLGQTLNQP
jgi:hypothetical protein